jgi:deoxyadenosine/deoxycytidine kinase
VKKMRVVVTGVCASGKTTLVKSLQDLGIDAYNVAQEHSLIGELWNKKDPDLLVVLDAKLVTIRQRRIVPWGEEKLVAQHKRLVNACEHADLYLQTDDLSRDDVVQRVLECIRRSNHAKTYC